MFQIQNAPQTQAADTTKPKQAEQKETTAQEFQNTIFQQFGDKVSAGVINQIYNNNDVNHSGGLDGTEKAKAMADVNAYITSAINGAASGGQSAQELGDKARQGAVDFNNMTPEQQAADIKSDLTALINGGHEVTVSGGQVQIDGQALDLKSLGVSDESMAKILQEVEKFVAEQADKK